MNQDVWGDGSHEITRTVPHTKSLIYLHYFRGMLGKQLTLPYRGDGNAVRRIQDGFYCKLQCRVLEGKSDE